MIWFKLKLKESNLDDSKELTTKVRELLGTDDVLYTGSHEINENDIEAEDRFWEEYEEWEYDLLAEGTEEEPQEVDGRTVIVITTVDDEKVVQIKGDDLPVWYVKGAN
jgi:hypothetical protein